VTVGATQTEPSMLEAALAEAARGRLVFPLHGVTAKDHCTCGKYPCGDGNKNAGKHPRETGGFYNATGVAATIRAWWTRCPDANIGIRTGRESGLVVLDIDPRNGGDESLEDLRAAYGDLPETVSCLTGGGGSHHYFAHPGDREVKCATNLGGFRGIDLKADGGYVIAPPSQHASGREYVWNVLLHPEETALAPCPSFILGLAGQRTEPPPGGARPGDGEPVREGARNATLTSLAGTMRRRGMSESAILAALVEENARFQPPLAADEVASIAKSVSRYAPGPTEPEHLTDLGNARRLCARFNGEARFRMPPDEWVMWNGRHWAADTQGQVIRFAKEVALGIYREAAAAKESEMRASLAKHAIKSESARAILAMVEMAKTEADIPADPMIFDADPWLFNVQNGTLDLRTGKLREHRRSDFITKIAPVQYAPGAVSKRFEHYLALVLPDAALRSFVQRAIGYSMTGLTTEERLFLVYGPTASGKSTLLESVKATFGSYAMTADFDTFLARRDVGCPRPDVARLEGARFVSSIEVEEGKRLAEGLVKQLTGGDTVTARELFQKSFEFVPQCTLWLAANDEPRVRDDDGALWRRILQIPFSVSIPEDKQDPKVKAELRDPAISGPAILAWAVVGCLEWQKIGLAPPAAVLAATKSYRERMDPIADFLDERCEFGSNASVSVAELFEGYCEWCKDRRVKALGKKAFSTRLAKRPEVDRDRDREEGRLWIGIRLRAKP